MSRSSGPGGPRGLLPWGPGKEVALPPPPPLRTTRECFHPCSSSLSNAPCGTRLPLPQGCRVRTAHRDAGSAPRNPASGENLHDTGLGPTHIMGGRTSRLSLPSSACLLKRLTRFSRDESPEGSRPAFAWGDLARGLNPYPPDYRAAFAFSLILYPPPHRRPPCGGPTPRGGRRAYHVPRTYHGWLRLCLFAGGSAATAGEGRYPCTWPPTFWFKPLSAFGLLDLTIFISSSPELALPPTLAPDRHSASSRRLPVPGTPQFRGDTISSGDTILNFSELGMVSPELAKLSPELAKLGSAGDNLLNFSELGMVSPELLTP